MRELYEELAQRNKDVWVDWEDVPLTAEWREKVYSGIRGSDAFVFIISPDSATSKVCRQELEHAVEHNKRLVLNVYRDVDEGEVPSPLGSYNWILFRKSDDFEKAVQSLVEALDTDLEWVQEHTRLLTRAIEWDSNGRDNGFVRRGSDLRAAEEWQARAAEKETKPTPLQTEYILASRKAQTRRQRMTLGAVTLGLSVTAILGVVALLQRKEAVERGNEAIARQLAAQSELLRSQGQQNNLLPRSVLLAVESMPRFHFTESDQALRGGLDLLPPLVSTLDHPVWVYDVEFSSDGEYLASAGEDGTAKVSYLWPEDLVHEACARLTRNLTIKEWQVYLRDEPYRETCPGLPVPDE